MKRTTLIASAVVATSLFLSQAAVSSAYAATASVHGPIHAMFSKTKIVSLSLRNDSGTPIELKVGEDVMTLAIGKTVDLKLAVGTRILSTQQTPKHAANSLITQVSTDLNGATIAIK